MSEVILAGGIGGGSGGIFGGGSSGGVDTGIPGTGSTAGIGKNILDIAEMWEDDFTIHNDGSLDTEPHKSNIDMGHIGAFTKNYVQGHSGRRGASYIRINRISEFKVYGSNYIQFTVNNSYYGGTDNYASLILRIKLAIGGGEIWILFGNNINGKSVNSISAGYNDGLLIPVLNTPVTYTAKILSVYAIEKTEYLNKPTYYKSNADGHWAYWEQPLGKWCDDNTVIQWAQFEFAFRGSSPYYTYPNPYYMNISEIKFLKV